MNDEELERLLSKELDGALSPEEAAALVEALATGPQARARAESWRALGARTRRYAEELGQPSPGMRTRIVAADALRRPEVGRHRLSWGYLAAAGVLLAVGLGFAAGRWSGERPARQARSPSTPFTEAPEDFGLLKQAVSETWRLLPRQVAWTGLRGGRLLLGTQPLPARDTPSEVWLVSFWWETASGGSRQLCQVALMGEEEADLSWQEDGAWRLKASTGDDGAGRRLLTTLTYCPIGEGRTLTMQSGPALREGQRIVIASACLGAHNYTLCVRAQRLDTRDLACGEEPRR